MDLEAAERLTAAEETHNDSSMTIKKGTTSNDTHTHAHYLLFLTLARARATVDVFKNPFLFLSLAENWTDDDDDMTTGAAVAVVEGSRRPSVNWRHTEHHHPAARQCRQQRCQDDVDAINLAPPSPPPPPSPPETADEDQAEGVPLRSPRLRRQTSHSSRIARVLVGLFGLNKTIWAFAVAVLLLLVALTNLVLEASRAGGGDDGSETNKTTAERAILLKTIRRIVTKTLNNTLHKYFDSDDDETENIARALGPQSQPTQDYSDHRRADDEDLLATTASAAASDEWEVSED